MSISARSTVRDVVTSNPAASRVFEALRVDYCCGGSATLEEAARRADVPLDVLLERLSEATPSRDDLAIAALGTSALVEHIERTHHPFTTSELARAGALMAKVLAAHGARHPHLKPLADTLLELTAELTVHMQKEERVLFPFLRALDASARTGSPLQRPPFQTALHPIRAMHDEHDAAGDHLRRLRELSSGYALPADACGTFRALYDSLTSLERDLHQHIQLENNVLFPRVAALEEAVFAPRA